LAHAHELLLARSGDLRGSLCGLGDYVGQYADGFTRFTRLLYPCLNGPPPCSAAITALLVAF
jgi:hypothetical protein